MEFIIKSILDFLSGSASKPARTEGQLKILEYSMPARIMGSVFVILFGAFLVFALLKAKPEEIRIVWGVVGSLFLISLFIFIEFFRVKISYDQNMIYTQSPWRDSREIPWPDVSGASFSQVNKWYLLKTDHHGNIRASVYLMGISTLVEELKRRNLLPTDKESR